MKRIGFIALLLFSVYLIYSCNKEDINIYNPNVDLFVKQLKEGTYNERDGKGVMIIPHFTENDIPNLLRYADDLTVISYFPTVYNGTSGNIRLGECILWIVESLRLGSPASQGCNMVIDGAINYEAIYFLTDNQLKDAATRYRLWWNELTILRGRLAPTYNLPAPLYNSGYKWW